MIHAAVSSSQRIEEDDTCDDTKEEVVRHVQVKADVGTEGPKLRRVARPHTPVGTMGPRRGSENPASHALVSVFLISLFSFLFSLFVD